MLSAVAGKQVSNLRPRQACKNWRVSSLNPKPSFTIMTKLHIRKAEPEDLKTALEICLDARDFQRSCGFVQWGDGYPSRDVIGDDIAAGKGYMIEVGAHPKGYCVIDTDGDREYDAIPELWATESPYAAVHRLALSSEARGQGIARIVLAEIERILGYEGIFAMRVDTGLQNQRMHRLLDACGFKLCGAHSFSWGPRLAYEKEFINE